MKRVLSTAIAAIVLSAAPAFAQAPSRAQHPYDLDPYKPSDLALLRGYGGTLVTLTPLSELRKLDPYVPSHAALLQQLGAGLPLWGLSGYPWYAPVVPAASLTPFPGEVKPTPSVPALLADLLRTRAETPSEAATSVAPSSGPTGIATLNTPDSNDGVWIAYEGRRWIVAGRAVTLDRTTYVRVGEHVGFPVFRRSGAGDDTIHVAARGDSIVPYRLKP
jgi:hypothetical protein